MDSRGSQTAALMDAGGHLERLKVNLESGTSGENLQVFFLALIVREGRLNEHRQFHH